MKNIIFQEDSLFEGIVTHTRISPFIHKFKYYVTYFWFDIKNFKNFFLFKKNKFSLFSFYENDHGSEKNYKNGLYEHLLKNIQSFPNLKVNFIKMFCLPRILGYSFNPISIFICYDKSKKAKIAIFEVNNTFNERHAYYCKILNKDGVFYFKKKLYVSPFFKVRGFYKINLKVNKNKISLLINYEVRKKNVFSASFFGKARKLTSSNLIKVFLRNMLQNMKITFGIYYQALKLYLKGAKYIKKPFKSTNKISSIK